MWSQAGKAYPPPKVLAEPGPPPKYFDIHTYSAYGRNKVKQNLALFPTPAALSGAGSGDSMLPAHVVESSVDLKVLTRRRRRDREGWKAIK
jgi:hypothetical protein